MYKTDVEAVRRIMARGGHVVRRRKRAGMKRVFEYALDRK